MGKALVAVKEKTIVELFEPLTKGQRLYLYLRLVGLDRRDALRNANRKASSLRVWLADDPQFSAVEEYVLGNKEKFLKEAKVAFMGYFTAESIAGLVDMLERGKEWDKLPREDKPYVMQARLFFAKLGSNITPKDGGSYEEMIHRIRKEI